MEKIPHSRQVVYLLILGLFPLLGVIYNYILKKEHLETLNSELSLACVNTALRNQKEALNRFVKTSFQSKDRYFLEKQLGSMKLLNHETHYLQKLTTFSFHPEEEQLKRRFQFITSKDNQFSFVESQEKRYLGFVETIEATIHPVEVDLKDLQKVLAQIEGAPFNFKNQSANRPQLIITDFQMSKKKNLLQETYALQLKILKREYSQ